MSYRNPASGAGIADDMIDPAFIGGKHVMGLDSVFIYCPADGTVQLEFASGLVETFSVEAGDYLPYQRATIVAAGTSVSVRVGKLGRSS